MLTACSARQGFTVIRGKFYSFKVTILEYDFGDRILSDLGLHTIIFFFLLLNKVYKNVIVLFLKYQS